MALLEECPGAGRVLHPYPEYIKCPHCEAEVEIWSDEGETKCDSCGKWVVRELPLECLEWCEAAEECVGPERWAKYSKTIEAKRKRAREAQLKGEEGEEA